MSEETVKYITQMIDYFTEWTIAHNGSLTPDYINNHPLCDPAQQTKYLMWTIKKWPDAFKEYRLQEAKHYAEMKARLKDKKTPVSGIAFAFEDIANHILKHTNHWQAFDVYMDVVREVREKQKAESLESVKI